MEKTTDEQLIRQYLNKDEKSFEILIKRYVKPIYRFTYRKVGNGPDAEDITQEVFLKVWRNIKKFNFKNSFKSWIFKIAGNASIDLMRKKKSILFSAFENEAGKNNFIENLAEKELLLDELIDLKAMKKSLVVAAENLPLKSRAVFNYRFKENLTFREISEILKEPISTIKSRCMRTAIKLKKFIEN